MKQTAKLDGKSPIRKRDLVALPKSPTMAKKSLGDDRSQIFADL
jgi:hypothetical protein